MTEQMRKRTKKKKKTKWTKEKIVKVELIILIILIPMAILGYTTSRDVIRLKKDASDMKATAKVLVGQIKAGDCDGASEQLDHVDELADDVTHVLNNWKWRFVGVMPFFKDDIAGARKLAEIAKDVTADMGRPAVEVLRQYPLSELKTEDGGFRTSNLTAYIDLLEEIAPELEELSTEMDKVHIDVIKIDSLSKMQNTLRESVTMYQELEEYLPFFHAFVGDGSDKTYLLVAQNGAEIRASGGFPGSIGIIRIEKGILTVGDFNSVYDVLSYATPEEAQITYQENVLFGNWMNYPRDACYNPDFPRVAEIWMLGYERKNDEKVEGVVSVAPAVIQRLLAVAGPITLTDQSVLDGTNATKMLQHDLYFDFFNNDIISNGASNDVVDSLFAETAKKTLKKVMSEVSVDNAKQYLEVFQTSVADRTIMIWMEDEKEEQTVEALHATGSIQGDEGEPTLGVYFSCSDPSKLGWYVDIDTTVSKTVSNGDGTCSYEIEVILRNAITQEEIDTAGVYIKGSNNGAIKGFIHIFAPQGASISDASNDAYISVQTDNYQGLDVAYSTNVLIYPEKPITYTCTITLPETQELKDNGIVVKTTPTLTEYR